MDPAPEASERGDAARAGVGPVGPTPVGPDATPSSRAGVVVPLRAFRGGKSRLAPRLDADGRAALARALADRVADAAAPHRTVVVSSDPDVVAWAGRRGLDVVADPGSLDAAARAGSEHLAALGVERVVIAHADLALVTTLAELVAPGDAATAVVVPCRRLDGTPLLSLPTAVAVAFPFAYGPASFARHVGHAQQHGLAVVVPDDPALRHDVDDADDLDAAEAVLGHPLVAAPGALLPVTLLPVTLLPVSEPFPTPARALAIGAHCDDIEFGAGGTLARWADDGCVVHLCVCTDGSKGSWDPDQDLAELVATRQREQRAAAAVLGAEGVTFLGAVDGELEATTALRRAVAEVIRATRPDVVLGHDPWQRYRLHPDHRAAGFLTTDGVVAARDWHFFPDAGPPHRPRELWLFEADEPDHVEGIDGTLDRKVGALMAHRSQWRSTMGIDDDADAATASAQTAAFAARIAAVAVRAAAGHDAVHGEDFRRIRDV